MHSRRPAADASSKPEQVQRLRSKLRLRVPIAWDSARENGARFHGFSTVSAFAPTFNVPWTLAVVLFSDCTSGLCPPSQCLGNMSGSLMCCATVPVVTREPAADALVLLINTKVGVLPRIMSLLRRAKVCELRNGRTGIGCSRLYSHTSVFTCRLLYRNLSFLALLRSTSTYNIHTSQFTHLSPRHSSRA
jgi:hypothetical protein